MMDSSYLDITMRQGFAAFREFMTKPEARMQFASSDIFHELSEIIPMPNKSMWSQLKGQNVNAMRSQPQIVVDMLTDVRCPFAYLADERTKCECNAVAASNRCRYVDRREVPFCLSR